MPNLNLFLKQLFGGALVAFVGVTAVVLLMKYPNPRVSISEYYQKKSLVSYAQNFRGQND